MDNRFIDLVGVAAQGISHHRLRSFLSILGIICGVMAVLTMISVGEGAKHELLRQIESLGTNTIHVQEKFLTESSRKEASSKLSAGLTVDDTRRISAALPGINTIATAREIRVDVVGLPADEAPLVMAVSSSYAAIMGLTVSQGRFVSDMDVHDLKMVCVVGDGLAERLRGGGVFGDHLRIGDHLLTIVGRVNGGKKESGKAVNAALTTYDYNDMVFVPSGLEAILGELLGVGRERVEPGRITSMILQTNRPGEVFSTGDAVRRILEKAHHGVPDYQVIIPQALLAQARKTQSMFNLVLGAIAGVSLLVGGIGIMNIMLATVSERTREIGLRRAVGATRHDIVAHFLMESVLLTFTGGILGVVLGCLVSAGVASMGRWQILITPWAVFAPVIMAVLVGIFFGLYPAVKASRMDPIKALRFE